MDRREIDDLWTLSLEDFTRARDELARKAKDQGDRESAKEIKALRKPSVAAWAVNQLARERASEIKKLLQLGGALREAQRKALEGGGADPLRSKVTERRRLVDGLTEAANGLLEAAGHPATRATLDRVSGTLTAATVDPDVGEAVGSGTVQRDEAPPSGLEELAALVPFGGTTSRSVRGAPSAAARSRTARAKEKVARLEEEASEAEEEARGLRTEADRAARDADRAARRAAEAEERAARLRDRADEARKGAER